MKPAPRQGEAMAEGETRTPIPAWAEALAEGLALCCAGHIEWSNDRFAELAGHRDPRELVGVCFGERIRPETGALPEPGDERPIEAWIVRAKGDPRRVRVARLPGVESGRVLWRIEDVAELRELEEELLEIGKALHEANRELATLRERVRREAGEREELLTIVSHELRTPVTVILGYDRLLLSEKVGPLNEEQRHFLQESTKSCQRLSAFIGNLLETARDVRGEAALEVCERSLAPTLEGVVSFLKPLLDERGLRVELDCVPEAAVARFDPLRIEQVLTNLVGNAIKYARPGGTIRMSMRALREGERALVEVSVEDDGPGIAPEDRERIFEPYVRVGESRSAGGLGLGLAIARRIVDAHGGTIRVEAPAGGGSRFVFSLPAPSPAGGIR